MLFPLHERNNYIKILSYFRKMQWQLEPEGDGSLERGAGPRVAPRVLLAMLRPHVVVTLMSPR